MNKQNNFWLRGKANQQEFYRLKIKAKTNLIGTLMALLTAVLLVLPLALMIFQFLFVYGYSRQLFYVYLTVIWLGILFFNGLINYFTVRYAKSMEKDNLELQNIEQKYIFFYQCLNIVFALITLIIIIFFAFLFFGGSR